MGITIIILACFIAGLVVSSVVGSCYVLNKIYHF